MKKCKKCGKEVKSLWSKGLCKSCSPKTPLKAKKNTTLKANKGSLKKSKLKPISEARKLKRESKKANAAKLYALFQKWWDSEPHYSELSGEWLGYTNSSIFWHHILPKASYKEAEFDRENIIRLTATEHANVEANPTKYEIINQKRAYLKEKYGK